jgi:hypothetical protein
MVRALRLDIEVDPEQENNGQEQDSAAEPEQKPADLFHPGKLRNPWLKKR